MLEFQNRFNDFVLIYTGVIIGALPFVTLGTLISVIVSHYIKSTSILKYKSKNNILSHIQSAFIGVFLPVCECGNIPLAKRLLVVGFKKTEVVTFLLAAPILNPIVWFSTAEAFNLDKNIAWIRVIAGGLIAIFIGLFLSYCGNNNTESGNAIITEKKEKINSFAGFAKTALGISQIESENQNASKYKTILNLFALEFFSVFKVLLIACFVATLFQTFIPRSLIEGVGQNPILSVFAMIFLAFLISICSSVDAFFALAFSASFSLGSIISFLVFGPMIDVKLIILLRSIFPFKTILQIATLAFVLAVILGFGINSFYKFNYF